MPEMMLLLTTLIRARMQKMRRDDGSLSVEQVVLGVVLLTVATAIAAAIFALVNKKLPSLV
ncbi:hypothetical protein Acy02nite_89500 [Actinoplanes cyaneus]|uniref:Uncharacterized protein n=1 Tax=Actinoplanes cyaneus TaxID=52696 RepID=A0A919IRY7_9ACTN|nr:hypothetical protein [Actinoplanes cyaneus]MCW2144313.1 hypothetical protein [Actinoplanes cyaneus]GID71069.1 hypothetical protein Acy02nite_89500 [Actinoplanes cyaneus]